MIYTSFLDYLGFTGLSIKSHENANYQVRLRNDDIYLQGKEGNG